MGALGETLSGLNPKLVSANGAKGLFQLTPAKVQTMVDAAKFWNAKGLNLNVDDVMKNPVDQIKLVEWYLFGSIWKKHKDTKNPLALTIAEFVEGEKAMVNIIQLTIKEDGKGSETKYEFVKKYLKNSTKLKLKNFFQALKGQS